MSVHALWETITHVQFPGDINPFQKVDAVKRTVRNNGKGDSLIIAANVLTSFLVVCRAQLRDMERMSTEENTLKRDRMEFERNMALAKHDQKEVC